MPVLAASLLWMTTRRSVMGDLRTRALGIGAIVAALSLFAIIAIRQLVDLLG